MREFTVSAGNGPSRWAFDHGRSLAAQVRPGPPGAPLLLTGSDEVGLAALAVWALAAGHAIVLQPDGVARQVSGLPVVVDAAGAQTCGGPCQGALPAWQVAMYTSGSTGTARAYGFTLAQLNQLAAWYTGIYQVTSASVVVTHLPVAYNFTFVAGVYLAATLGARLHLADSPTAVFADASVLARTHDRCIILGNPVLLAHAPKLRLPGTVLIDSGGAPLSTTAISHYREHVADLREGYGLTETGSLTHFDWEATPASLGTVGTAMPQVKARLVDRDGQPRVAVATPSLGTPVNAGALPGPGELVTSDVGSIDTAGRLRVLGRSDDHPVGGLWPRDTLDVVGALLGTACALVRHPTPHTITIRLHRPVDERTLAALRTRVADRADTSPSAVSVDVADDPLLHSHKLPRPRDRQPGGK